MSSMRKQDFSITTCQFLFYGNESLLKDALAIQSHDIARRSQDIQAMMSYDRKYARQFHLTNNLPCNVKIRRVHEYGNMYIHTVPSVLGQCKTIAVYSAHALL
jgi:hypothetical protein